jgi:hypothetical protein
MVFGHPHHGGNGEELTLIEFILQYTDSKSVGAYRKFTGNNACNPKVASRPIGKRTTEEVIIAKLARLEDDYGPEIMERVARQRYGV